MMKWLLPLMLAGCAVRTIDGPCTVETTHRTICEPAGGTTEVIFLPTPPIGK